MENKENKKYYYLKLKEDFFDSEDMKILESMENGYLYSNILLKMYLKSLKNNGELIFKEFIPYNPKMLATITGHNIDVVEKALNIFRKMNFIEVLDNGTIYMLDVQQFIGKISSEGKRKAEYREKIKQEKIKLLSNGTMSQDCPNIISISNSISLSNSNNEELNNKENKIKESIRDSIKEIVEYLNEKTRKHYRVDNQTTTRLINALFNKKYTIENIKQVIDCKCKEWLGNEYEKYLRPETLFGNKFESYLNSSSQEQESLFDKLDKKKSYGKDSDYVDLDGDYNF